MTTTMSAHDVGTSATHPYTCLACSLAFVDAAAQRAHYNEDLHRYNSKRRVAGLAPVTAQVFNDKIRERQEVDQGQEHARLACKACNKSFSSEATKKAHEQSKKHREAVFKAASATTPAELTSVTPSPPAPSSSSPSPPRASEEPVTKVDFESSGDAKLDLLVARRLRSAPPLPITSCLFCTQSFPSLADATAHMRHAHSFVIPDEEYVVDLEGLFKRLGEEVGTWNVCICCGKGYGGNIDLAASTEGVSEEDLRKKASKGIEAVRAHMQSKSHCRIPYDTDAQKLDLADFYDFRPSYPDYEAKQARKAARKAAKAAEADWEDEDMEAEGEEPNGHAMEVVEDVQETGSSEDDDSDDELPESEITYGDTSYELVLPSGARIGHRSLAHAHKLNLAPYLSSSSGSPFTPAPHDSQAIKKPSKESQALLRLVPAMKNDSSRSRPLYEAGLVRKKGGEVMRAKNKGEAKQAAEGVRKFKDFKAYQDQAFIRGIRGNSQKHFRDPLLQ